MDNFDFCNHIWNTYGTLEVYKKDGKYYWNIDDYALDSGSPQEIPKYLYDALKKHYKEVQNER